VKIKHGIAAAAALALLLVTGAAVFAASPGRVSYQGTLRKNGVLFSGTTQMEFRITNADASVSYWNSGSTDVVVSTGLFRYPLGSPNESTFDSIVWKEITPYVQMRLGVDWLPAEPLFSSVYSLHSKTAESSTGTFVINGGDLKFSDASGTKGIIFADGTSQYSSPGWAVSGQNVVVSVQGNTGMGTLNPATKLDVKAVNLDPNVQFWRNSAGVVKATMTAAGLLYADGSQLTNLPAGADNLGNHTATQNLNLNTFNLVNVSSITASNSITSNSSIIVAGPLGLYAAKLNLNSGVEIASASAANKGGVYISGNVFLPGGAQYYGDGSMLGGVHDSMGSHIATKTLNMNDYQIIKVSSLTVTGGQGIGAAKLTLNPNVEISGALSSDYGGIYITTHVFLGPNAKYYGDGSGLSGVVGMDNLGNHIMTTNLATGANWISYDGSPSSGLNMDAAGHVGIGQAAGLAGLDLHGASGNNIQLWRDSFGTIQASMTVSGAFYADGSQLRNVRAGGTANKALNMASFDITSVSTITVSSITSSGAGVVFSTNVLVMQGRLGVNTALPRDSLDVNGNIMSSSLAGSGDKCVTADNTGKLYLAGDACGSAAGLDNMGNHTMTTNLNTNGKWVSGDASGKGLTVSVAGKVGVGLPGAAASLDVQAIGADTFTQIWRDAGGVIKASMTTGGVLYADASKMSNLPVGGDSFGNHTATKTVDMGGNQILNVASVTVNGALGVGAARLSLNPNVELSSAASAGFAGLRVSSNVYIVGFSSAAKFYGDGSALTGVISSPDDLGNHTATQNLNMSGKDIIAVSTLTLSSVTSSGAGVVFSTNVLLMNGRLGVNTALPLESLDVNGNIMSSSLSGFTDSCVSANITGKLFLTGSPCGTVAGNDNMGNHIMAQNLNTNGKWISGDTTSKGLTVSAAGKVGVGLSGAAAILDVQVQGADPYAQIWRDSGGLAVASMSAAGYLYADASKLRNLPAGSDNLGSHIATQNLNMSGKDIVGVSTITLSSVTSAGVGVVFSTNVLVMKGRLGVNTATPQQSLDVNGSIMSSSLSGSGTRCVTADNTGKLYLAGDACGSATGLDNMGNHIMVTNLATGNNWISPDGTAKGIRIDPSGNVSIGGLITDVASARLDVQGSALNPAQTWRDTSGVVRASMTIAGVLWADGSKLRNLPVGADNLGNHIATTTLRMANFPIVDAGSITVNGQFTTYSSATVAGASGVGAARLALNPVVEISSDSSAGFAGLRVSSNVYIVGYSSAARYYGDGSLLTGLSASNINSGTLTDALLSANVALRHSTQTFTGSNTFSSTAAFTAVNGSLPGVYISSGLRVAAGMVGIGPAVPAVSLHISSAAGYAGDMVAISTGGYTVIRMTGAGGVHATRFYGDGSQLTGVISSPDGMGNHTATQNLNMSSFDIASVSTITVSSVTSAGVGVVFSTNVLVMKGSLGVNTALPRASLDVAGSIMSTSLSGTGPNCVYADEDGKLSLAAGPCGSADGLDNLGNHKMTQNLQTGGNWISYGPGAGGGLSVNISSNVGIGILSAATRLDVQPDSGDLYAQIWRNSAGVIQASMTASGVIYAETSGLRGLPVESDPIFMAHPAHLIGVDDKAHWDTTYGWGDHQTAGYAKVTAARDMNLNNFSLVNVASITATTGITSASMTVIGELGVGTGVRLSNNETLSPAAGLYGGIAISTNVNLASGAKFYIDGVAVTGGGASSLAGILAANPNAGAGSIVNLSSAAIGRVTGQAPLDVQAIVTNTRIQIWRNEAGTEVSSMTASGVLQGYGAILDNAQITNQLDARTAAIDSGLAVGNWSGVSTNILATVMGIFPEADIDPFLNVGVVSMGLVNPAGHKGGSEMAIGGFFRGGIGEPPPTAPNAYNFPTLIGVRTGAWANTSGIVQNSYGLYVQNEQSAGTVTNNYGIIVEAPNLTGGAITSNYGLYVKNQTGFGTGYNIYSEGASSTNRFEGSVEVGGGVKVNTTAGKPTCAVAYRGMFWVTQSGAGVKDAVEVCAKDAANAYAWRTIY